MALHVLPHRFPGLIILLIGIPVALAGCFGGSDQGPTTPASFDAKSAAWNDVVAQARHEGTVTIVMWGGSDEWNNLIDQHAAPALKEKYGITVKRVPVADTPDFVTPIIAEKQAGLEAGSYDVGWINGENFRKLDQAQALYGPIQQNIPSFTAYYDKDAAATDFGYPTKGNESPWGRAQFVMIYDSARVPNPPSSWDELQAWIQENPGRFTYPAPAKPGGGRADFTGSAFVRNAMLGTTGGAQQYLDAGYDTSLETKWTSTYDWLNVVKPDLWRDGTDYPQTLGDLDRMYADGEVWMTMDYSPSKAAAKIADGTFPVTTRTFVFDSGTLANTHFLAVPWNAPHKAAALVLIDYLESPEAQLTKYDPKINGDFPAINIAKLSDDWRAMFNAIDLGPSVLPLATLERHAIPEIDARYVTDLEQGWLTHVLNG
jgi:putative spermidine/putrescine transport system substrate-binding protein